MIHQLTKQVWFGDAHAPREAGDRVCAVLNVAHVIRGRWGYNLNDIPFSVSYFRLASPDRHPVSRQYIDRLGSILVRMHALHQETKLPVLTHCQFGGHRGPTSAIAAAYMFRLYGTRDGHSLAYLKELDDRAFALTGKRPCVNFENNKGRYYRDVMAFFESLATNGHFLNVRE